MPDPTPREPGGAALCTACRHLYTTWRAGRPRGCRAYGFESSAWPADVVLRSSGSPCGLFEPRPARDPSQDGTRSGRRRGGGTYG